MRRQSQRADPVSLIIVGLLLVGALIMGFQEVQFSELLADGTAAPEFSLKNLDGESVRLSQQNGQIVLVNFWATWCGPCRAEMPSLTKLAHTYGDRGVRFLAINTDDVDDQLSEIDAFVSRLPALRPYVLLGIPEVGAAYAVRSIPTLYVVDRRGNILTSFSGQASEDDLRALIEEALRSN